MQTNSRGRGASRRIWRSLLAALVLVPTWLPATDLYQATVPVAGAGVEERNAAIGEALKAVLVKISGRRSASDGDRARALAATAPNLVQQYRYEAPPAGSEAQRLLQVRFDAATLIQTLRDQGLPVWAGDRPTLLLWLGVEERSNRRFLQPEADPDLAAATHRVATERGLDFLLPLMDMEDFGRLQASDLWGGFDTRVRDASRRYGADLILLGRLSRLGAGDWRGHWQLLHPKGEEDWRSQGDTQLAAAAAGLQEAVDRVAARYAPTAVASGTGDTLVLVRGVRNLPDLQAVERFFAALDTVQSVRLIRLEPDQAWFRLGVTGGNDALSRGASLGGLLVALTVPGPVTPPGPATPPTPGIRAPVAPPDLVFQLNH